MKLRAAMWSLAMMVAPAVAGAQVAMPCSTCDECTRMLAQQDAEAQLSGDIDHAADRCITIRGAGARFNGAGHKVHLDARGDATVGVSVEADDVMVHNVRVENAATGVSVRGRGDTLLRVELRDGRTGIALDGARDLRVVRSVVHGAAVGVRSGALEGDACATSSAMTDPGLVIVRSTIESCEVGLAACGAAPVLAGNVFSRNGVGVLLGAPTPGAGPGGSGPFDACVQAPTLDHVRAGTLLLFSSGCGGCQVHEGWVPSLRRRGADLRVRETGPEALAAQRRFDHYMRHCAPEVIDALGVPGCVPNYACPVSHEVGKVRSGERQVAIERSIDSEDSALVFAQECARIAGERITHGRIAAMVDNYICQSRRADVRAGVGAASLRGTGNHCDRAEGWHDESAAGCASPCGAETPPADHASPPPPEPAAPAPAPSVAAPTPSVAAPTSPAPSSPYVSPPRAPSVAVSAPSRDRSTTVIVAMVLAMGVALWFGLMRLTKRP